MSGVWFCLPESLHTSSFRWQLGLPSAWLAWHLLFFSVFLLTLPWIGYRSTSHLPGAWVGLGTKTSQTQMCLVHCPETSVSLLHTSVQKTSLDLIPVHGWCFPEGHSCAEAFFFTLPLCIAHLASSRNPPSTRGKHAPENTAGTLFLSFTFLSQIMALHVTLTKLT